MTSPPMPRKKPPKLGVAWQLGSPLLSAQEPNAFSELALSMPNPVAPLCAVPPPMLRSKELCARAHGKRHAATTSGAYHWNFIRMFSFSISAGNNDRYGWPWAALFGGTLIDPT